MSREAVLIVDDDEISCEALRMFLISEGFPAVSCNNGLAALERTRIDHFGVFLINYRMPILRGDDVTRLLRISHPNALIVGFSIASKLDAFRNAGADIFINKEDLVPAIATLLRNKQYVRSQLNPAGPNKDKTTE